MSLAWPSTLTAMTARPDVAIDLGTANTRVCAPGRGPITEVPSVVTDGCERGPGPHPPVPRALRPLRGGVITDLPVAVRLLSGLLGGPRRFGRAAPRALVCAPTDASGGEIAALVQATRLAGAREVALVSEPLAAAVGAGLDIASEYARLVVDLGDGVTDIALIASGRVVSSWALRTACADLHQAVSAMVMSRHGLEIGAAEAERLTRESGILETPGRGPTVTARGLSHRASRLETIDVERAALRGVIEPIAERIACAVATAVREIPGKSAVEVIESGITLTGGGALLAGMDRFLETRTRIEVRCAVDPLRAVILGAREMLQVGAATGLWDG